MQEAIAKRKPELLAPAGDWDCLKAAAANGADAVYFGLDQFNARHRATNFTLAELPKVVEFLHGHNIRAFVAFNILIFSEELKEAERYLQEIARAGVDAVIVQDLGLAKLARMVVPELEIHASTQMTISDSRGATFAEELGATQAVLAREMSIEQIAKISEESTIPLEVFVHGALCVAYSGQCLTSEALGGRSANRGQCAQACRMPYEMIVDGKQINLGDKAYLLSPQDLAGHEQIAELIKAGVTCFKIEGRLKGASYVAATTRLYREAIDCAMEGRPFEPDKLQLNDLTMAFSRGFTPGFLHGNNHQKLVRGRFPKSRGLLLGHIIDLKAGTLFLKIDKEHLSHPLPLQIGDGIVIDLAKPEEKEPGGRVVEIQKTRISDVIEIRLHGGIEVNKQEVLDAPVWKTDDPDFRKRMESSFARDLIVHRVPLDFKLACKINGPLHVEALCSDGTSAKATWEGPVQEANQRPFELNDAKEYLGRLGSTPFSLGTIELDIQGNAMIPATILNKLRRELVDQLIDARKSNQIRPIVSTNALEQLREQIKTCTPLQHQAPSLVPLVRNHEQLDAVLAWAKNTQATKLSLIHCDFEDTKLYKEAVTKANLAGIPISLATLRVIKPGEDGFLTQAIKYQPDALLIRSISALRYAKQHAPSLRLIGDWSLNCVNEISTRMMLDEGLERVAPGNDLNWEQLKQLVMRSEPRALEIGAHLHMPMFHMEHCVFAAFLSEGKDHRDCGRPCETHKVSLKDRSTGAEFPVGVDSGCRNTVYNSMPQSAAEYLKRLIEMHVTYFRIEFLRESTLEVHKILDGYGSVLSGKNDGKNLWQNLKASNQVGLTRGTFNLL